MNIQLCFLRLLLTIVRGARVRVACAHQPCHSWTGRVVHLSLDYEQNTPGKLVSHATSVGLHKTCKMIFWCSGISQQNYRQKQKGFSRNTRPCCSLTPLPSSPPCLNSSSPPSPLPPPLPWRSASFPSNSVHLVISGKHP